MSNAALLIPFGILGEYVAKIFEESKGRPLYIVADAWNVAQTFEPAPTERIIASVHAGAAKELP
jgi:dolichol-phosphate mannosyltransferase